MSQIRSIQVLRAAAALAVTFGHVEHEAAILPGAIAAGFAPVLLDLTGAGVDLFFVISGFIMVYAARDQFGRPGAGGPFLLRRIARIVPLYWLATGLFLVAMAGGGLSSAAPDAVAIVKSFLFIPYAAPDAATMLPAYKLGWTLNYEMFFYALFAVALALPRRAGTAALAAGLAVFCALGTLLAPPLTPFAFWSHPIVLEFVMGAGIATALVEGVRLPLSIGRAAVLAGVAGFAAATLSGLDAHGPARPLLWGVPAALVVAGAALRAPASPPGLVGRGLVLLGDASYAAYLLHPMVIRVLSAAWRHLPARLGASPWSFVALGMVLTVPAAILVHLAVERPLGAWLAGRMRARAAPRRTGLGPAAG